MRGFIYLILAMKLLNNIKYYLLVYSVILSVASLAFLNYGKKLRRENLAYKNDVSSAT